MKTSITRILFTITAFSAPLACQKQPSQQPQVDSTTSDARSDIAKQPGSAATPNNSGQEPVTTNPNSSRAGGESTLGTSQGAAVVGDANINPAASPNVPAAPTSVDNASGSEPRTDAAVSNSNCLDATARDYDGKTVAKNNDCPPSSQSPIGQDKVDAQGRTTGR